jgi:hypothetical protein
MLRTYLYLSVLCATACADGAGSRGTDFTGDPASEDDDGSDPQDDGDGDAIPTDDGTEADATAGDAPTADAGTSGPDASMGGLLDPILEYTTCEPGEINPVVNCLTVTCPMNLDPVALVSCMLDQCAPLVEAVNDKCKECITAAVAQDTAGLLQNCLKVEEILPGTNS